MSNKTFIQNNFKFKVQSVLQKGIKFDNLKEDTYYPPRKWHNTCINSLEDEDFRSIVAPTGCITGDSIININRCSIGKKTKIETMYKGFNRLQHNQLHNYDRTKPTYVRSFKGGTIQLNEINDVIYSGVKDVYKLTLKNGRFIKATPEHKILTKNGWKELIELTTDDLVMCDTLKAKKSNTPKKERIHDVNIWNLWYHPYAGTIKTNKMKCGYTKRIEKHRAIYEAHLNNLTFDEYKEILRTDPEKSSKLMFIDPNVYDIHHIDLNHKNNDPENLQKLTKVEHQRIHSQTNKFNFNQGIPQYSEVVSVEYWGKDHTYDISCIENHNFVANGIVVHNSGKSFLMKLLIHLDHQKDPKRQHVIVVPKLNIGHGFKKTLIEWEGEQIELKVSSKWVLLEGKDNFKTLKNFFSDKGTELLKDNIIICTHATMCIFHKELTDKERKKYYKNVSLYVDESHHLELVEEFDEEKHFNSLGCVVNFFLQHHKKLDTRVTLATATFFRSNGCGFVAKEYRDLFKIFTHSFSKYFEEDCKYLKSFSYDTMFYEKDWIDSIEKLFSVKSFRDQSTIIFLPHTIVIENKFKEKDKYEFVTKIRKALKKYDLNIVDLITEKGQDKGLEQIRNDNDNVKNGYKPSIDVIIAMNMFQEGSDYVPLTNVISIGFRKSLPQFIQMVGRAFRDYKGKQNKSVKAITLLSNMYKYSECINNSKGEVDNLKDAINQNIGVIFSALLMEDIMMPDATKIAMHSELGKIERQLTPKEKKDHDDEKYISLESLVDECKKQNSNIWFEQFKEEAVDIKEQIVMKSIYLFNDSTENSVKPEKMQMICKEVLEKYGCTDIDTQKALYSSLRNSLYLKNIMHKDINKFKDVNLIDAVDITEFFINIGGKAFNVKNIVEWKRTQNWENIPYPEYDEAECFSRGRCPVEGIDTYEKYQDHVRMIKEKYPNANYYNIKAKFDKYIKDKLNEIK